MEVVLDEEITEKKVHDVPWIIYRPEKKQKLPEKDLVARDEDQREKILNPSDILSEQQIEAVAVQEQHIDKQVDEDPRESPLHEQHNAPLLALEDEAVLNKNEFTAAEEDAPMIEVEVPFIEEKVPVVEEKVPFIEEKVPVVEEKVPVVEEKVPFIEEKVPVVEEKVPVVEEKVPVVEEKVPMMEERVRTSHKTIPKQQQMELVLCVASDGIANDILLQQDEEIEQVTRWFLSRCQQFGGQFYHMVEQFRAAQYALESERLRVSQQHTSLDRRIQELWTIKQEEAIVQARCADDVIVSHTFRWDVALFDETTAKTVQRNIEELTHDRVGGVTRLEYEATLALLSVELFLHEFLTSRNVCYDRDLSYRLLSLDDVNDLKSFADVLFHFEQSFSYTRNHFEAKPEVFLEYVHKWISFVVDALYRCGETSTFDYILRHIIRTRGIAKWGSLVQFPDKTFDTPAKVQNFLRLFILFLAPIQNDNFAGIQEENSNLEDTDPWLVLDMKTATDDEDVSRRLCLNESDYCAIFERFPFVSFVRVITRQALDEASEKTLNHAYGIVKVLFTVICRSLLQLPEYLNYCKLLAKALVTLCWITVESTAESAELRAHDPLFCACESQMRSELDSLVLRMTAFFIQTNISGVSYFLSELPFGHISSLAASQVFLLLYQGESNVSKVLQVRTPFTLASWFQLVISDDTTLHHGVDISCSQNRISKRVINKLLNRPCRAVFSAVLNKLGCGLHSVFAMSHLVQNTPELADIFVTEMFVFAFLTINVDSECARQCTEQLATVCNVHHAAVSHLLHLIDRNPSVLPQIITFFELLDLTDWVPITNDLDVISRALRFPSGDAHFTFGSYVFTHINFGYTCLQPEDEENKQAVINPHNLCLSSDLHRDCLLVLADARSYHLLEMNKKGILFGSAFSSAPPSWWVDTALSMRTRDLNGELLPGFRIPVMERVIRKMSISEDKVLNQQKISLLANDPLLMFCDLAATDIDCNDHSQFNSKHWEQIHHILRSPTVEFRSLAYRLLYDILPPIFTSLIRASTQLPYNIASTFLKSDKPYKLTSFFSSRTNTRDSTVCLSEVICAHLVNGLFTEDDRLIPHRIQGVSMSVVYYWLKSIGDRPKWMSHHQSRYLIDRLIMAIYTVSPIDNEDRLFMINRFLREQATVHVARKFGRQADALLPPTSLLSFVNTSEASQSCAWLTFQCLFEETLTDRPAWLALGSKIVSYPRAVSVSRLMKRIATERKLRKAVLYDCVIRRWALYAVEVPPSHPLLPLYWQMFFSLYFAKVSNVECGEGNESGIFGYLLLEGKSGSKLKRTCIHRLRFLQDTLEQTNPALHPVFRAMYLWLSETRPVPTWAINNIHSIPDHYLVDRLLPLLTEDSFDCTRKYMWIELLPHSPLVEEIGSHITKYLPQFNLAFPVDKVDVAHRKKVHRSVSADIEVQHILDEYPLCIPPSLDIPAEHSLAMSGPVVKLLKQRATAFGARVLRSTSLDKQLFEYIPMLYQNDVSETAENVPCNKSYLSKCRGPAYIKHRHVAGNKNISISNGIQVNRDEALLCQQAQEVTLDLCAVVIQLSRITRFLVENATDLNHSIAIEWLYAFIELDAAHSRLFPVTSGLITETVNKLSVFVGPQLHAQERLITSIRRHPHLIQSLYSAIDPTVDFVRLFRLAASIHDGWVLSRFDIQRFLLTKPSFEDRLHVFAEAQTAIQQRVAASAGERQVPSPPTIYFGTVVNSLSVFPDMYMPVLEFLLESSKRGHVPPSVWLSICRSPLLHQSWQVLLSTANMLSQYFWVLRRHVFSGSGFSTQLVTNVFSLGMNKEEKALARPGGVDDILEPGGTAPQPAHAYVYTLFSVWRDYIQVFFLDFVPFFLEAFRNHDIHGFEDNFISTIGTAPGEALPSVTPIQQFLPILWQIYSAWLSSSAGDTGVPWTEADLPEAELVMNSFIRQAAPFVHVYDIFDLYHTELFPNAVPTVLNIIHTDLLTLNWSQLDISVPVLQPMNLILAQALADYNPDTCTSSARFLGEVLSRSNWTTFLQQLDSGQLSDMNKKNALTLIVLILGEQPSPTPPPFKTLLELLCTHVWDMNADLYAQLLESVGQVLYGGRWPAVGRQEKGSAVLSLMGLVASPLCNGNECDMQNHQTFVVVCRRLTLFAEWLLAAFHANGPPPVVEQNIYADHLKQIFNACCNHVVLMPNNNDAVLLVPALQECISVLNYNEVTQLAPAVLDAAWDLFKSYPTLSLISIRAIGSLSLHQAQSRAFEACCESYLFTAHHSADMKQATKWQQIVDCMTLPVVDRPMLIKTCLANGCALTLVAMSLQSLQRNLGGAADIEASLKQLLYWMGKIQIPDGQEMKLICMACTVLSWQIEAVKQGGSLSSGSRRIYELIKLLQNFGSDRAGLFGFSRNRFSPTSRLLFRALASYLSTQSESKYSCFWEIVKVREQKLIEKDVAYLSSSAGKGDYSHLLMELERVVSYILYTGSQTCLNQSGNVVRALLDILFPSMTWVVVDLKSA